MQAIALDILIFGGGIAGLWSLARLQQAGFAAMLIETNRLGGIQTIASQGIIHGGVKYALTGQLTNAATTIAAMPGIWRACLANAGELDLSRVKILAQHQYLWSTDSLSSTIAGFFASHALRSRIETIHDVSSRPQVLQHPQFNGQVYRLDEPVLDVKSLVTELIKLSKNNYLWIDSLRALHIHTETPLTVEISASNNQHLRLQPRRVVLAAGAGNSQLLNFFGKSKPVMQLRPLHMLIVRGPLPPLYAHCLGASSNPRLTITTHPLTNDESVWYIGGQLAETGINRTPLQQIAAGKQELAVLLPWLNLNNLSWISWRVERAELYQPTGMRPDGYCFITQDKFSIMWPTKLAFAPALGTALLKSLEQANIQPQGKIMAINWPAPPLPTLPWE